MKVEDIHNALRKMSNWGSVYIPEFTYRDLRIDALIVDIPHRWIRGFEIKTRKQDFFADCKWQTYSSFCSSLSIVCPVGLIQPEEITKPFGLLWLGEDLDGDEYAYYHWKKRPKKFNHRNSLAWTWIYLGVLEMELPRLIGENKDLTKALKRKEQPK